MPPSPLYSSILNELDSLDPKKDNERIVHLLSGYAYVFDFYRSQEFALFKTFGVPSISGLLNFTQEFAKRGRKRYDDTGLLLTEIARYGYSSKKGGAALSRMNEIHSRFKIRNENYLLVLCTFIYEPIDWIAKYSHRPLSRREQEGLYYFWFNVATRMEIKNIPPTIDDLRNFYTDFQEKNVVFAPSNAAVVKQALDFFCADFPAFLHSTIIHAVRSFLPPLYLEAFGLPPGSATTRSLIEWGLFIRSYAASLLPDYRKASFFEPKDTKTYPDDWLMDYSKLGPKTK